MVRIYFNMLVSIVVEACSRRTGKKKLALFSQRSVALPLSCMVLVTGRHVLTKLLMRGFAGCNRSFNVMLCLRSESLGRRTCRIIYIRLGTRKGITVELPLFEA